MMKKKIFLFVGIAISAIALSFVITSCEGGTSCYTASSENSCKSTCGSSSVLVGYYTYTASTGECCCEKH